MIRRLFLTILGLFSASVLILGGGIAVFSLGDELAKTVYPGSIQTAVSTAGRMRPDVYYQRINFYSSQDPIYEVYRWYANRFGMSLRTQWQRDCVSLYSKTFRFGIERVMEMTVCDLAYERMIILERAFKFAWP